MVTTDFKKKVDHMLLALGLSLMIGIMVLGQDFRDSLGTAVGFFMDPLISLVGESNFHLILFIMAAITALYASLIQKYTIDWELMRNTQEGCAFFRKSTGKLRLQITLL